jgi:death-on-curing protein
MAEIDFLGLDEILEIHRDQIERYGGSAGIRDMGLLQSAVAMPAAGFGEDYLHNDIFEMAAAYLFHVTQNHPFVDGNKRTGAVAAVVFLDINGVELNADEDELEALVRSVATGEADKAAATEFFKGHSRM